MRQATASSRSKSSSDLVFKLPCGLALKRRRGFHTQNQSLARRGVTKRHLGRQSLAKLARARVDNPSNIFDNLQCPVLLTARKERVTVDAQTIGSSRKPRFGTQQETLSPISYRPRQNGRRHLDGHTKQRCFRSFRQWRVESSLGHQVCGKQPGCGRLIFGGPNWVYSTQPRATFKQRPDLAALLWQKGAHL